MVASCPLTDPTVRPVIAHRGGAGRAPENTLAAFAQAPDLGADAVELDVRLSRDGEVVVIHDPTVDRTTSGHGSVHQLRAADLERLDAGARFTPDAGRSFPYAGRGVGVPRLADVVEMLPGVPLLIEIKVAAALRPTVALLEHLGAVDRSVVASADWRAVAPARGGRLRTGASSRDAALLLVSRSAPRRLPYETLCIPQRHWGIPIPIGILSRRAKRAGTLTHVWTVNDAAAARRLWRLGVSGIITDVPDRMVAVRSELPPLSPAP